MPAQEPVLPFPSPASLDALTEQFFDWFERRARIPAIPYAHSLLRLGDATAKGSPGVAFNSTTPFDPTTLTVAVLPSYAEPPLLLDQDSEGW